MLAMFLSAIEGTIVATAMPSIAARLGGVSLYGWVFSSYLLMQAGTTPIFGKLSDLFGRKHVFIIGIVIFLAGSVLCGFARSMEMLVFFRLLQGIGAGAVQPITVTLVGDLYSLQERGRVQGYMASVWGVSSIVGPLAGGIVVERASWAWIFWLNVPVGLLTIGMIALYLHEDVERKKARIDYLGAALLLLGLSSLLLALTEAAEWGFLRVLPLFALFVGAGVAFVRQERRAAEPVVQMELWRNPLIALANAATLMAGLAMIGLISFVPTFVQGVQGRSALAAGLTLAGMTLGWPIASVIAGRLFVRLGVRPIARTGGVAVCIGGLLVVLVAEAGPILLAPATFVMGVGFGLLNTTFIVAIQTSVAWTQRGAATAANMLMRLVGNAAGAAVFGGLLNLHMARYLREHAPGSGLTVDNVQSLLNPGTPGSPASPPFASVLQAGLSESLHLVFWGVFAAAAATMIAAWLVPDLHPAKVPEEAPVA
ncbi:MAG: MFS transporter [Gemmatimonadetes bacterium]|nr:MFS transporter [Gemmatimonadota bacterium]